MVLRHIFCLIRQIYLKQGNPMKLNKFNKLLAALSFFACTSLSAAPLVIDVAGIQSYGEIDDPGNTVLTYNVGANSTITSVGFNVNITAFRPSFLAEIGVLIEASDQTGSFRLFPDEGTQSWGTGDYTDFHDLVDLGLSFDVGSDGILRLEFFDDFNDFVGSDGQWNFGTITFGIETVDVEQPGEVPEPSTTLLMGAGLATLGYASRRRRAGKRVA